MYAKENDILSDEEIDEEEVVIKKSELRKLGPDIKYNTNKLRPATRHHFVPKEQLALSAKLPVKLVPIRIDIELESIKLKDAFTWNLNGTCPSFHKKESHLSPEQFSVIYAEDIDSPFSQQLSPLIAQQIREQCLTLAPAIEEDILNDLISPESMEEESNYGDIRIVIKLDLQVGNSLLCDQFEWPLFSNRITPAILCADLGMGGEFVPAISHAIRDQVCQARLNFDDAIGAPEMYEIPIRPELVEDDWEPELRQLTEQEIEKIAKEKERSSRRLRRSQKFQPYHFNSRASSNQSFTRQSRTQNNWRSTPTQQPMPVNLSSYQQQNPRITHKNFQPTQDDVMLYKQYNPHFAQTNNSQLPQSTHMNQRFIPLSQPLYVSTDKRRISNINDQGELVTKQVELMRQGSLSPTKRSDITCASEDEHAPPRVHRGFGASAGVFNAAGSIQVGEFRKNWRCSWCLLSGKFTPTLRKGPLGTRTLCNACGIWYQKHGSMPEERYHEHVDTC